MGIEFRRAASEIEQPDTLPRQQREHLLDGGKRHRLGAGRAGVDVAVHTAEIADVAQVDLQRVQLRATDRGKSVSSSGPGILHGLPVVAWGGGHGRPAGG